jgi:MFS family permease
MSENGALTRKQLNTPKAAAIAGIIFSVLLIAILGLLRRSVPADPLDPGAWLATGSGTVTIALNLVPFAGVAFLWFIGVLRDRLGQQEDRFFATVFFGSALLFLAMLFAAAAIAGAVMLLASSAESDQLRNSPTFRLARATVYIIANAYAIKMACVFMISTSTVVIRTEIAPRWIAILGFVLASILLVGSYFMSWSIAVLPVWVFLLSVHILIHNLRGPHGGDHARGQ